MKICILGLGYIGLPTAAMIAANGYDVVGVDTNRQRVEALQSGGVKFDEPGLAELVSAAFLSGKLRTACEVEAADVYVICVPTPLREGDGHTVGREAPDLSFVHAAAVEIAKMHQTMLWSFSNLRVRLERLHLSKQDFGSWGA